MTAEELAERMSARELAEWAAFERVCGPVLIHERIDVAAAHIMASIFGQHPRAAEAFMPSWDVGPPKERPQQSAGEMIAVVRSVQRKKESNR